MPLMGFHVTIDKPDSVNRVAPPTITMENTIKTMNNNHNITSVKSFVFLFAIVIFQNLLSDDIDDIHIYMRNTHSDLVVNLGLNDEHFDTLSSILSETLTEKNVDGKIRATLSEKFEILRPYVLNK